MALKNMKCEKKKGKKGDIYESDFEFNDGYPYGLKITLENSQLQKLGINVENLKVGKSVEIMAKAKIDNLSMNDTKDGKRSSASLQITDLEIITENSSIQKKLYGDE